MALHFSKACITEGNFEAYKAELDKRASKSGKHYEIEHSRLEIDSPTLPAIVITVVDYSSAKNPYDGKVEFGHCFITRDKLLKVLGMSQDEFKLEFNKLTPDQTPEGFETREV